MEKLNLVWRKIGKVGGILAFAAPWALLFSNSLLSAQSGSLQRPRDAGGAQQLSPAVSRQLQLDTKLTSSFTVAAVGDLIEPQPFNPDNPRYQKLLSIIRGADVAFANEESTIVDVPHFPGPFGDIMAITTVAPAIKSMGFAIVNRANNHDFDGGLAGMLSTDKALDDVGIVHAGSGMDLNEARSAQFLPTPKGRVGLVGMVSFDDSSPFGTNFKQTEASYRVNYTGGAPGVNALHLTTLHIVTPDQLQTLRKIRDDAYGSSRAAHNKSESATRLKFFDEWYESGSSPGSLSYEMNPSDLDGILRSVREGKILSDFMIATIHVHQTSTFATQGTGSGADFMTPDFMVDLAHECIDNGADMFIGHGVHNLRGVEIYHGKPIFYGLSAFVFQRPMQWGVLEHMLANPELLSTPGDFADQESLLTTSRFEGGRLIEVRLYPVDRGGVDRGSVDRPVSQEGIPMIPTPEAARRILDDVQAASKPFGTKISIEDNVGVIRIP